MATRLPFFPLLLLTLAACSAPEVIEPLSPANTGKIDFSGHWHMREDPAAMRKEVNRAIFRTAGIDMSFGRPSRSRDGKASGGLVYVFLETGKNLKITQTDAGMFLSYDRAIVEEYRFGENREVTVGQVEAQRVSGWVGDHYVVETLGRNRMKLTEDLSLSADRQVLLRRIVLRSKSDESVTVTQTFARQSRL